jgi:hypothetical protein
MALSVSTVATIQIDHAAQIMAAQCCINDAQPDQ